MRIQPLALRHNISEAVIYTPETSGGLRLKLLSWEFSEIKAFLIYFLLCCTSLSSLTFSSGSTSLYTNPHLRVCFWGLQLRSQVKHCFPKTLNDFQHWSQQHNILIFCIRLKALCSLKASRNHILFRYFILFFTEPGDKVYTKWAKLVSKQRTEGQSFSLGWHLVMLSENSASPNYNSCE